MRVSPTNSPTVQLVCPHERDYVLMRNAGKPVHDVIGLQQTPALAGISDQQLTVNQIVPGRFVSIQ